MVVSPEFNQRVTSLGQAGVTISHVTMADKGDYSVEVTGTQSDGTLFRISQQVSVEVCGEIKKNLHLKLCKFK